MKPNKFPHQQFLEDNKDILASHPLPEMLQKRILGFEDLQENLAHTTDEDNVQLLSRLEKLSYELDEDLEEYFEEQLENNHEEEPESTMRHEEPHQDTPDEAPLDLPKKILVKQEATSNEQRTTPSEEKVINRQPPSIRASGLTDEEILDMAVKDRMTIIHPSELFKRGFKGVLGARTVFAGRYFLQRGKYETCYRIGLRGE